MEINNEVLRSYLHDSKTFIIEFHSGIGNSLTGFFYGLYIYSLFNLDKTHNLIIVTIPNHRGYYSFTDFFSSSKQILYHKINNFEEKKIYPDNYVKIDCNILYTSEENLYDLKTILYKINPIPKKFYEDEEVMYRIKIICKQLDLRLKKEIKDKINNFINHNFENSKVYGVHLRSTDSKHNKGKIGISKKIVEPFKLVEVDDFKLLDKCLKPVLGEYSKIEYNGKTFISKIVRVDDDKSFSIIFDNSQKNNISKIFNVKSNSEFILDLSKYDKKYTFSESKIMKFNSIKHLIYNLKFLSSTTKLFNISGNKIIEKEFKPNKDFQKNDIIEIYENKNTLTGEITTINFENKDDITYNIIYHDHQMLNTIEKDPNLTNFFIENIYKELSDKKYTKIFVCSDDIDLENKFKKEFSKKYTCFSFNKKEKVTKIPWLENYPWYIDKDSEKDILNKVKHGLLKSKGGPANNGVLIGIPYNTTCSKEQLIEALIDSTILSNCTEINKSWNGSTFSIIGNIINNLDFLL